MSDAKTTWKILSSVEEPATRIRRGKVVVIPPEWVGKVPAKRTIRQRRSKQISKRKDFRPLKDGSYPSKAYMKFKREGY